LSENAASFLAVVSQEVVHKQGLSIRASSARLLGVKPTSLRRRGNATLEAKAS
jgi:hypothetical protein